MCYSVVDFSFPGDGRPFPVKLHTPKLMIYRGQIEQICAKLGIEMDEIDKNCL